MSDSRVLQWFPAGVLCVALLSPATALAAPFEIIALPDTENYVDSVKGFHTIMAAQTQWIVDNRAAENIVFVTQLGDLIHHDPANEMAEATSMIGKLDQQVPYSVCAGNHELESTTSRTLVAQNFGPTRYAGYSWYKGSYNDFNHSQVFSAGGYDFLHINLQKDPDAGVLNWAQGVITANPGKPTIISTHDYLNDNTTRTGTGDNIWNNLVNNNPQVFLTLNGHMRLPPPPTPPLGVARMLSNNAGNKSVLQVLSDFEDYTTQPSGKTDTGYLRKIIFDPDNQKITVQTYSPTYAAVPWLTDGAHQFSYDAAFLPQVPGTALSPIFVTDAAICTAAGYAQGFDAVPGPSGTALPLGWTVKQIVGDGATFSNSKRIQPANIAAATPAASQTLLVVSESPAATWGSQAANAPNDLGRATATNPGSNGAAVVQLKITNGTGAPATGVHLNYDLNMLWSNPNDSGLELPGYALFWSRTGGIAAADWTKMGEDGFDGAKVWDITLPATLDPGADFYFRWADDNVLGPGGESAAENVWSIDNVQVRMSRIPTGAVWVASAGSSWGNPGSWSGSVPQYAGDMATFADSIGGTSAMVTLDGNRTVGALAFAGAPGGSYTISEGTSASGGKLILDGGAGAATVTVDNGGSHTVSATASLAAAVTVNTISGTLTFSGQVQGPGRLIKDGAGTLVLNAANSYAGGTQLKAGAVQLGHKNALGTGELEMAGSTAVVDLNGVGAVLSSLSSSGTAGNTGKITDLSAAGPSPALLEIGNSVSKTYGGLIEDDAAGGKNKIAVKISGTGEVVLTSSPRYSGDTEVADGTLTFQAATGDTKVDGNATLTIAPGAKVNVSGIDPFTTGTLHTAVVNNSRGFGGDAGFNVLANATTTINRLDGAGSTWLGANATLNTGSLVQDTVTIDMGTRSLLMARGGASGSGGTAVPEPGTWLLLAAATCMLPMLRRRLAAR